MTILRPFIELQSWLGRNFIGHKSLHVILNFGSADEAARFDAALRRDLDQAGWFTRSMRTPSELEIAGLKIKIESPIHDSP